MSAYFRCPYHLAKELHKAVDIIFAPYNYLIDRGKRKALQISWSNSILIFDEAHNLVRRFNNKLLTNEIYCIIHCSLQCQPDNYLFNIVLLTTLVMRCCLIDTFS